MRFRTVVEVTSDRMLRPQAYGDRLVVFDVLRLSQPTAPKAVVIVDQEGNFEVAGHMQRSSLGMVVVDVPHIPPPSYVITVDEFTEAPEESPRDVFDMVLETARETIVFEDPRWYEILTAWELYTWVRGVFPKNINIYVTGFPGTGKTMVLQHVRKLARYPLDYEPAAGKSFKWNLSQTMGVLVIDEAEYLSRSTLARLRKMHDANVIESRFMGIPMVGLTLISLRVDAPIALAATHMPKDIAFLQRGYIIRMVRRKPKVKSISAVAGIDEMRVTVYKSMLLRWFELYKTFAVVADELREKGEHDERVIDLAAPVAAVLKLAGRPYEWVLDYAERSYIEAMLTSPETLVFAVFILTLRENAREVDGRYVIDYSKVKSVIERTAETVGARVSDVMYLIQYAYAGCKVSLQGISPVFICDKESVDNLVRTMQRVLAYEHGVDAASTPEEVARAVISERGSADESAGGE